MSPTMGAVQPAVRSNEGPADHLQRVIEAQPVCLTRISGDGTFLAVNELALTVLGAERLDQVLEQSFVEMVALESRDACREFLSRVAAGERGSIEVEVTGLGGRLSTLQVHAIAHPSPTDSMASVLCTFRDISENRRLEQALVAAAAQNKERVEATAANEASLRALEEARAEFERRLADAERRHREAEERHAGEEERLRAELLTARQQSDAAIRSQLTRTSALEESLRAAEARELETLEAATAAAQGLQAERDAVSAARDALRAELDAATAARDALRAERDTAVGARDARQAELEAAMAARDALQVELEATTAAGLALQADLEAATAARDARQTELDAATAARDAGQADLEAATAARDALKAELEARLLARNALQAELVSAATARDALRAELDEAVAAQGALLVERDLARTEHEQETARQAADRESERLAGAAHLERADRLARAVMRASRIARQVGRAGSHERSLAAGPALSAIEPMLRALFDPNVAFTVLIGNDRCEVALERHQLEHVIVTLAANRRAAMTRGGQASLEVAAVDIDEACAREHVAAPGAYVLVALHAKGPNVQSGMPPDLLGASATAHQWESAGPGMAGVFEIVSEAGGYFWARREGTDALAFEVYLPRAMAESGTREEPGR
jgi:PAS domain S-box-containing protein